MDTLFWGAIIAICAALISLIDKWKNKTENKYLKTNITAILYFFIAFIGISMSYYSGYYAKVEKRLTDSLHAKQEIELKLKNDSIKNLIILANSNVQTLSDSLNNQKVKLEKDNYNLSRALSEAGLELKKKIIGSLDPCYISFRGSNEKNNSCVIVNTSSLPIYDLDIIITDFTKMMICKVSPRKDKFIIDEVCYKNCSKIISTSFLLPGNSQVDYVLPDEDFGKLEIRFIFKQGVEYLEQLIFRRYLNQIQTKGKLFLLRGNKYEFVLDINHEFKWDIDFKKEFNVPLTARYFMPIYWR